jgi:hypothetical protein
MSGWFHPKLSVAKTNRRCFKVETLLPLRIGLVDQMSEEPKEFRLFQLGDQVNKGHLALVGWKAICFANQTSHHRQAGQG